MRSLWHRLLCYLNIRNEFDYVPPMDPDVPHRYEELPAARCCFWCGGGSKHAIHQPPFVDYREKEVERVRKTLQD